MSTKVVFMFALFALVYAEECSEEKMYTCLDDFIDTLLSDSENETCSGIKEVTDCLKSATDACLEDEKDDRIDQGIKDLEDLLSERCGDGELTDDKESSEDEEKSCLQENLSYMTECWDQGLKDSLKYITEQIITDENAIKCTAYILTSQCIIDRAEEKCGKEAAAVIEEGLADAPKDIEEACFAMDSIERSNLENKIIT